MLNSQEIQTIRTTIRLLLKEYNISYKVTPFDDKLYQECIDEALRRGYPMDDEQSLKRYFPDGIRYAASASKNYTHRPAQIWMALYITIIFFVDDIPSYFPSEIPNLYLFNTRFIRKQEQGNTVLDALADLIRQVPDLFPPVLSNLITTSSLDFITTIVLDWETASMQISSAARQYPTYHRHLTGLAMAPTVMAFPPEIPWTVYIQAIPEAMEFVNKINDVLSFYKEELAGENNNQISILAARNKESKLEALKQVAGSTMDLYKTIVKILEGYPEACSALKCFVVGYFDFHFAVERYKLADLDL